MSLKARTQETIDAVRSFGRAKLDAASPSKQILIVQVMVIVTEYVRKYIADDLERFDVLDVEGEIVSDVVNPATGRPSPIFDHASKLDGLAFDRWNNEEVLIEHKSTTEPLDAWSPYWRRLVIDSQVSKYLLSLRQSGKHSVRSLLYDVVTKPTTKPKDVVKADVRKIAETGQYCGFNLRESTATWVRCEYENAKGKQGGFTGKLTETLELYGLRLRRMVVDDPARWFARKLVTRTDDELEDYARELWELGSELRHARRSGVWPKNSTHCSAYGRLCEFFALCCGEKSAEDDGFKRVDFVHNELEERVCLDAPDGGRNLLTNSRLTMFQSCKRRHRLHYEDGLRKATPDSSSVALFWGTLFHDLLRIVWNSYRGES